MALSELLIQCPRFVPDRITWFGENEQAALGSSPKGFKAEARLFIQIDDCPSRSVIVRYRSKEFSQTVSCLNDSDSL
jgi:hypothetical protein